MKRANICIYIPMSLWECESLTWQEKIILVELGSRGDIKNGCQVSPKQLAVALSMPVSEIKTAMTHLFALGALHKVNELLYPVLKPTLWNKEFNQGKVLFNADDEKDSIDYDFILSEWARINPDLPKVRKFTPKLKSKLKTLLKNNETNIEELIKVFQLVSVSNFLSGKNSNSWCAKLDWILEDSKSSYQKILAGNYHTSASERIEYAKILNGEVDKIPPKEEKYK